MRSTLLSSLALLLTPAPAAFAAENPPPATSSAAETSTPDGTAAAAGAGGVVFGVNGLPTVGGFIHLTPADSLRFNLGLDLTFTPGFGAAFSAAVGVRHHLMGGNLRPFLEGDVLVDYGQDVGFGFQGGFGVEYYFVPRVSVAGMLGLSLRFDQDGQNFHVPFGTTGLLFNVYL